MYDFLIAGGGVIGTSVARVLSRLDAKIALLEKHSDVAMGATGANSGILHAGHDCEHGTLMAKYNVEGNILFERWGEELDVPIKRCGSLVLAFDDKDIEQLKVLYKRGIENGVENIEIISKERALELEPVINDNIVAALWTPTAGIINPYELNVALYENSRENGVEYYFNSAIEDIKTKNDSDGEYFEVTAQDGAKYFSRRIINCAGTNADLIANMIGDYSFTITPRRGEYVIFDRPTPVKRPIFQVPSKLGKGVLVCPTVDGNFFIGPSATNLQEREDTAVSVEGISFIKTQASKTMSDLPYDKQISIFAGIRAVPSTGDFVIGSSKVNKNFINVSGICSPGLTSAPAIAEDIYKMFEHMPKKKHYNPIRKRIVSFKDATSEEKRKLISEDVRYSNIVCRCEVITEAEIVQAIKRGARTIDGIKRRTRATMGRCQGSFCVPKLVEIVSRELNIPMEQVVKSDGKSFYVCGNVKEIGYEI